MRRFVGGRTYFPRINWKNIYVYICTFIRTNNDNMTKLKITRESINVQINQRDATLLMNDLYYSLFVSTLYMFRTITSPSPGASSQKLYNALVCQCRRVQLLYGSTQQLDSPAPFLHPHNSQTRLYHSYIHATARLACTIPTFTQQLDSPARTYQCVIQLMR